MRGLGWLRRRRSYPRRQMRHRLIEFLRINWLVVFAFGGLGVVAVVPATVFLRRYPYLLGFVHGAVATFLVAGVGLIFLVFTGSTRYLSGAYGEDNTRDVLRRARRKRHIWGWIDNLEVQSGDVDHVVVAPSGIYAIDSKWHATDLSESILHADAAAARAAARRASLIMRSARLQTLDVQPVVVIWGRWQRDLQNDAHVVDGVEVLKGLHLRNWLAERSSGTISAEHADEVLAKLRKFKARVDPTRPPQAS